MGTAAEASCKLYIQCLNHLHFYFITWTHNYSYPSPYLKVVVRDLAASGTIRAQLRPLMNKIPVVGAVKISFLGAPTFTYKVSSYGINPMFIPGLETFINSFITGQVLQPFTYPDGFVVKLDPSAGDVASELPEGLLTVTLKEATGVPRMDFIGGADPYVKYESLGGGDVAGML